MNARLSNTQYISSPHPLLPQLSKRLHPSCSSQTLGSEPEFLPSLHLYIQIITKPLQLLWKGLPKMSIFVPPHHHLLHPHHHAIIISYLHLYNPLQLLSLPPILLHAATSMINSKYKTGPDTPLLKALQWYFVLRITSKPVITGWPFSRVVMTSDPRARLPGFKSKLYLLPAGSPWESYITSLGQFPHLQSEDNNSI